MESSSRRAPHGHLREETERWYLDVGAPGGEGTHFCFFAPSGPLSHPDFFFPSLIDLVVCFGSEVRHLRLHPVLFGRQIGLK